MGHINKRSISAILPNYNGKYLLEKNLPSLISSLKDIEHEIIVVDDHSQDDSVKFLKDHYPDIIIIQNDKNMGFSATCNRGVHAASKELLCLVNTDVSFTQDFFYNALHYFDDPKVFALKGEIINYENNFDDIINKEATSLLYYKRGFLRFNQRIKPDAQRFTGEINGQFLLLGCCFICDREMMLSLKGYNEIYSPFYWEDADLAIRALRRRYKLIYAPECKVFHQTSSTINKNRTHTIRRLTSIRNKFIFTWLYLDKPAHIFQHLLFTLLSIFTRWIILDWKFYYSFIWAIGRYTKYRITGEILS